MSVGSLSSSFRSLRNPAYRSYFAGQAASRTGTRMQDTAQGWFVLSQTGSGTALGILLAVEYIPMLLLSPIAGSLIDRTSRHRLIVVTQLLNVLLALTLAFAAATEVSVYWFYVIAALRGVIAAVDIPACDAFIGEVVPPEHMRSAASLNSFIFNLGRLAGPLLAIGLIALFSIASCFVANALSFLFFAVVLLRIHPQHRIAPVLEKTASIREGLRYCWNVLEIRAAMVMVLCASLFTYSALTLFPMLARDVLHGGVNTYAFLMVSYSLGFIPTVLVSAAGRPPSNRQIVTAAWLMALSVAVAAGLAGFGTLACCIGIAIFASFNSVFITQLITTVQLYSSHQMKGRVMSLWAMVLWGTIPVSAPSVGFIAQHTDPRIAMLLAASVTALGAAYATVLLRHRFDLRPQTNAQQSPEDQLIASRSLQDSDELSS